MTSRFPINGPALRDIRKRHGYTSATALAMALRLTSGQVYELERGRTTITEDTYHRLIDLFGLEDGALKVTAGICPHCGHAQKDGERVPRAA